MKERVFSGVVWGILMPLFLYYGMELVLTKLLLVLTGGFLQENSAMWLLAAKNLLMFPVFYWLYREEKVADSLFAGNGSVDTVEEFCQRMKKGTEKRKISFLELFLVILCSMFLSRAVNYLLGLTMLPRYFTGYETISEEIFTSSLISQVAASVISAPLLEETLMRGVIYSRLKRYSGSVKLSIVGSAFIFGIFHGNVVQGVYAFFLGLLFAWVYEAYDSLLPAFAAHIAANAASVFLNQTGWMEWISENLTLYYLTTAVFFLAGFLILRELEQIRHRKKRYQ